MHNIHIQYILNKVNNGGSLALKKVHKFPYIISITICIFLVLTLITKMYIDISDKLYDFLVGFLVVVSRSSLCSLLYFFLEANWNVFGAEDDFFKKKTIQFPVLSDYLNSFLYLHSHFHLLTFLQSLTCRHLFFIWNNDYVKYYRRWQPQAIQVLRTIPASRGIVVLDSVTSLLWFSVARKLINPSEPWV